MIRLLRNTLLFICSLLAAPLCAAIKAVRGKNEPALAHVVVSVPLEQITLDDIMGYDPSDPADRMSRKRHHVALKRALHELYPSQLSVSEKELQLKAILDYTLNTANELVHRGIYRKKKASQAVSNLFTAARAQVTKTFDAGDSICTKALNFLKALQSHTSNRVLYNASKKLRRFWAGITAGGIGMAGLFGWLWWRHKQSQNTPPPLHQSPIATARKPLAEEEAPQPPASFDNTAHPVAITEQPDKPHDEQPCVVLTPPTSVGDASVAAVPAPLVVSPSAAVASQQTTPSQHRQQLSTIDLVQAVARTGRPLIVYAGTRALEAGHISPGLLAALTSGWWAMQAAGRNLPSAGTALTTFVGARAIHQNRAHIRHALFPTPDQLAANGNPHPQAAAFLRGGAIVLAITGGVVTAYYYTPEVLSNALNSGISLLQSSGGQAGLVLTSLAAENFDRLRVWSPRVNNAAQTVSRLAEQAWRRVPDMPWWLGGRRGRVEHLPQSDQ